MKGIAAAGLGLAMLLSSGVSKAGTDLNEVGAFLVYPAILVVGDRLGDYPDSDLNFETFVTIVNASTAPVVAHVAYINGKAGSETECYECDFDVPLTGNDTEMLVVTYTEFGITIESEDRTISHSCPHKFGFMTVNLEDGAGNVLTDNVLLGSEVVVNYDEGFAFSIPAIPFQGKLGGNGNRVFGFDDNEYGKLPRIIAADFIAPDLPGQHDSDEQIIGALALFTLNFERQFPPLTECSITGYDAAEHPFSRSFVFGCWTWADLCDIAPEFCYPNLSATPCVPYTQDPDFESEDECDTHGWLKLDCRVRQDPNEPPAINTARGGVHGAIVQIAGDGSIIRRNDPNAPALNTTAAWARLLYQSVTSGDNVTLHLESPGGGLD
jgi:hypothetical protein